MPNLRFSGSLFSDDPFAAALEDHPRRKPMSVLLLLLIPVLGMPLLLGVQARPGAAHPILALDAGDLPSRSESKAGLARAIEQAHAKVLYWQQANCCGAATSHSRTKLHIWERGYRHRLALFARMYP